MPSASGRALSVPRTAFVLRSKITTEPSPSVMNPRPAVCRIRVWVEPENCLKAKKTAAVGLHHRLPRPGRTLSDMAWLQQLSLLDCHGTRFHWVRASAFLAEPCLSQKHRLTFKA